MRALITGASPGGIGGAVARRLAADAASGGKQASLVLTTRRERSDVRGLADDLRRGGARIKVVTADLTDQGAPAQVAREATGWCGGLDLVVANAGFAQPTSLVDAGLEHWEDTFALHVRAPWLIAQASFEALKESRGSFLAMGSTSGLSPHRGLGAYSASKAALHMLCQTLALEWGPHGVRANVIAPGPIATEISAKSVVDRATIEANAERRRGVLPLRRLGSVEDVASAVAFLAGEQAEFITGVVLAVDGGLVTSVNQQV